MLNLQQSRAVFSVSLPTRLFHACISSSTELLWIFNWLIIFHLLLTLFVYFQKNVELVMLVLQEHAFLPFWRRQPLWKCVYNQIGAFLVSPIFERPRFNPRQRIESFFNSVSVIDFYEKELCLNYLRDFRIFLFWFLFLWKKFWDMPSAIFNTIL